MFESNLNVTDSTISGCNATRGGAVYMVSGTASLARSNISNCIATESGGGLYSAGGRTSLSDGTLISGCSAEGQGNSIFLLAGEVSYTLPAPAGRWPPGARCAAYATAGAPPCTELIRPLARLDVLMRLPTLARMLVRVLALVLAHVFA